MRFSANARPFGAAADLDLDCGAVPYRDVAPPMHLLTVEATSTREEEL